METVTKDSEKREMTSEEMMKYCREQGICPYCYKIEPNKEGAFAKVDKGTAQAHEGFCTEEHLKKYEWEAGGPITESYQNTMAEKQYRDRLAFVSERFGLSEDSIKRRMEEFGTTNIAFIEAQLEKEQDAMENETKEAA